MEHVTRNTRAQTCSSSKSGRPAAVKGEGGGRVRGVDADMFVFTAVGGGQQHLPPMQRLLRRGRRVTEWSRWGCGGEGDDEKGNVVWLIDSMVDDDDSNTNDNCNDVDGMV